MNDAVDDANGRDRRRRVMDDDVDAPFVAVDAHARIARSGDERYEGECRRVRRVGSLRLKTEFCCLHARARTSRGRVVTFAIGERRGRDRDCAWRT